ncbi:MAG TPA: hypothetical protein VLK25_12470, partial [Allosphingosinicella sp.]|nr:hypothetical protein [Allosphingosinicella sp.]
MFKKIALSTVAAAAALTVLPAAAEAQSRYNYYGDGYHQGRSYDARYDDNRYDRRYNNSRRYNQRYSNSRYGNHYGQRCSTGSTGTIIGAIAGGLLGREVAGRG